MISRTADAVHKFITYSRSRHWRRAARLHLQPDYSRYKGAPAPETRGTEPRSEWSIPSLHPGIIFGGKHPVIYHDPFNMM